MPHIQCFAPIETPDATVLILGSMPGEASLHAGRYYAHPRNLFWRIMAELLGIAPDAPYEQRIAALKSARIALWDVLQSCRRSGSLDANIDDATLVPNDFATFLAQHPRITRVFFNGAKAEQCYRKRVLPFIAAAPMQSATIEYLRLPSTSPAHAALSFERKLEAWRSINAQTR
ncbi:MAG TPA: DNA-deoxyinosine glycosylase [Gallionella sp.]|nr:DNA-deoxyinosine glycosylase [Gallionella sp.]